jgi:carbonic anhydrase
MQLENLRTHPAVASRLRAGALYLHGWVYRIATGEVFAYDPNRSQFVPLSEYAPTSERDSMMRARRVETL